MVEKLAHIINNLCLAPPRQRAIAHEGEAMSTGRMNSWWRKAAVAAILPLAALGTVGCEDTGAEEEVVDEEVVEEDG